MKRTVIRKIAATLMASTIFFLGSLAFKISGRQVYADGFNPGIEAFVNSLYSDCLGRSADPTGFNDWCNKLATGQITGKQAAYGFFFSPEFQAKANVWSDTELINAYYKVFLNRGSDPSGASYWAQQIAGTTNDISILFTGFADSVEFANKCASYGITVGPHVNVPTTVRGASSGSASTPTGGATGIVAQTSGMRASSPEELDAYWVAQGFEIYYIDLGNGQTQKCYAQFYDMTNHNNMVNQWRAQNGLYAYNIITDLNDPRAQFARIRAVEVAYSFSHGAPVTYGMGIQYDPRTVNNGLGFHCMGENIANGTSSVNSIDIFRNSGLHNASMLSTAINAMSTAACRVAFVQPDGVSLYVSARGGVATPTELPGYNGGLPAGTAMGTAQCFWE